ncbi:MAG: trehalose-6-phosphate synthase [Phycisphaerales bacterium]
MPARWRYAGSLTVSDSQTCSSLPTSLGVFGLAKRSRLVIAANRLPAARSAAGTWTRSPGGLVSAMHPVISARDAVWVGWDGAPGRAHRPYDLDGLTLASVSMSRAEINGYYHGFCNATLWPLYHDAIQKPTFDRAAWQEYIDVNERFARCVARHATRHATVWIHDYHLQLVPALLRDARPDLRIGFFLHIPFPPEELFAWLPWRDDILRGLLGCDLVAFQTEAGARNFSRACRRYADADGTDRELIYHNHKVHVRSIPISIDFAAFERLAKTKSVQRRAAEIREQLGGRKVLLGVDRLDYTKGIPNRLLAFEQILRSRRASTAGVVMVQVAVPSREQSPGYAEIRREVEHIVGRINGQFSEPGKVAVHYFRRSLNRDELVAYFLAADVLLVTPLRDGMNLVAKEYVASRADLNGVLVLSEFTGAAEEFRRALLVNPRDIDGMADTFLAALRIPARDRRTRMSILRMIVRRHDVFEWSESFLRELEPHSAA